MDKQEKHFISKGNIQSMQCSGLTSSLIYVSTNQKSDLNKKKRCETLYINQREFSKVYIASQWFNFQI